MQGGQQVGWCELKDRVLVKMLIQHGRDYAAVRRGLTNATGYNFHIDHVSKRVIQILQGWEQMGVVLPPSMTQHGLGEYTLKGVQKTRWAKEQEEEKRRKEEVVAMEMRPPPVPSPPPVFIPEVSLSFAFHDVVLGGSVSLQALTAAHSSLFPTLPLVQSFYNAFASHPSFPPYARAFEAASLPDTAIAFGHFPLLPLMDLETRRHAATVSRFPFHPSLVRMVDEGGAPVTIAGLRRSGDVQVKGNRTGQGGLATTERGEGEKGDGNNTGRGRREVEEVEATEEVNEEMKTEPVNDNGAMVDLTLTPPSSGRSHGGGGGRGGG